MFVDTHTTKILVFLCMPAQKEHSRKPPAYKTEFPVSMQQGDAHA